MSVEASEEEGMVAAAGDDDTPLVHAFPDIHNQQQQFVDGGVLGDEGLPVVVDQQMQNDGNAIVIMAEDIALAGLDYENLENLTEEELGRLMLMAEQRADRERDRGIDDFQPEPGPSHGSHEHAMYKQEDIMTFDDRKTGLLDEPHVLDHSTRQSQQPQQQHQQQQHQLELDKYEDLNGAGGGLGTSNGAGTSESSPITMIINDDGSLVLSHRDDNHVVHISPDQIAALNVDVNNLTEDSIRQILQSAMPGMAQSGHQKSHTQSNDGRISQGYAQSRPSSAGGFGQGGAIRSLRCSQLVGEAIELQRDGKPVNAVIRYVRGAGGNMKVQFDDGHFEWITDQQIVLKNRKMNTMDHDSYHCNLVSRAIPSSALPVSLKRAIEGHPNPGVGGLLPVKRAREPHQETNFCCPICDNKVYQKEPSYIVVRIPACETCTREKIIVLDETYSETIGQEHTAE